MPLDFPAAPPPLVVGQVYGSWKWDGAKWVAAVQSYATSPYQPGPGLQINAGTTPPTIDVAKPYLPIDGTVAMTGTNLLLAGDPTVNLGAATKQYVDNHAGAVTISDTAPASPRNGALWWNSVIGQLLIFYTDPTGPGQWVQANVVQAAAGLVLPVTVAQGGTGVTTLAANVLPKGAGTAPLASSTISDAGAGVQIGLPAGGAGGAGTLALPGLLRINANAAALPPAVGAAPLLQIGNADANATSILMDGFGAGASTSITGRHAMGTNAAKLPTSNGIGLFALNGGGYDGTAYSSGGQAQIAFTALNNWSTTDHSTNIGFSTTPSASTTMALRMVLGQGLQISSVIGTDPGVGGLVLNANAAALPAVGAATLLHIGNVDAQATFIQMETAGNAGGNSVLMRSSRGTMAAPTATQGGDVLGLVGAEGYGATGYSANRAAITLEAVQTWTDTVQGSIIRFYTTPAGGTAYGQAGYIAAGMNLGTAGPDPGKGSLTLNANAAAVPLLGSGTVMQGAGPDGSNTGVCLTSSGGSGAFYIGRGSRGTIAAPTVSQNGDWGCVLTGDNYDGSGYPTTGYIAIATAESWGASNHGGQITLYTNTIAAGAANPQARLNVTAGVQLLGPGQVWPAGGDKGAGTLNANIGLYVNNVAVSTSDERLKENIRPASRDALAALRAVPLFEYDWRPTGPEDPGRHNAIGFVSQRMPEELGLAVIDDNAAVIDTLQLTAHLVRAVQQLAERLERAGI